MENHLGEVFALTTALFWALTSIFFTLAGQLVGSQIVNRVRLLLAAAMLSLAHLITQGTLLPIGAEGFRWGWLGLSAVVGLVIGDGLLFYAFTQIGARLSMLLMALAPILGTIMAWIVLGEELLPSQLFAIVVTVGGIGWVVLERNAPAQDDRTPKNYAVGVLCGAGAAFGQAAGLVLSKQGMIGDFPALSASLMRLTVAAVVIWAISLARRQAGPTLAGLRNRRARKTILLGTIVGPVVGMSLSLAAVQHSQVGIASTLMALSPVLLLPLAHWIFNERVTFRAVLGTVVAMAGVAMLFLF